MLNQSHALSGQIAQSTPTLRIDISSRQYAEPHQVREPKGIMLVVGVLESVVLHYRSGVHQTHLVPRLHQPIDQPIPIEGRLDRHRNQLRPERLQRSFGDR
jgi:hypothetical protein